MFRTHPVGRFANAHEARFHGQMARRFLTIMTGHSLPKIWQPREADPSIIDEKTIAELHGADLRAERRDGRGA